MAPKKFVLQRTEPTKKALAIRKIEFIEIYEPTSKNEAQDQATRCLTCGSPFCEWKCPLHNPISSWLKLAAQGRIIEAAELAHHTNSLPEVCGRVCPQDKLCEAACVLHDNIGAVTIGHIERYITDTAFDLGWRPDLSHVKAINKQVAIIGAGPAGLACADVLIRNGAQVTLYDKHPEIGGLLTFGIPSFKLEKHVMVRRREIFTEMGINFRLNTEIGKDIPLNQLLTHYDAIFVAIGSYNAIKSSLANEEALGVYQALPFLIGNTRFLMGYPATAQNPYVDLRNKKVIVLGGGDTAMDCARSAIRQNASHVICAYRRDELNMPCSTREFIHAKEEGVEFYFNVQASKIILDRQDAVCGIQLVRTQHGEFNDTGDLQGALEGLQEIIDVDAIIIAYGFQSHVMSWLSNESVDCDNNGRIIAGRHSVYPYQTSHKKIFAGGDVVRGSDLVVNAVVDGRGAAEGILQYLETVIDAKTEG